MLNRLDANIAMDYRWHRVADANFAIGWHWVSFGLKFCQILDNIHCFQPIFRYSLSRQCQTDSMLPLPSTTNGIRLPMPTLPSAGIGSVSGSNCVKSLTILLFLANFSIQFDGRAGIKSPKPNPLDATPMALGSRCQLCHQLISHWYRINLGYLQKILSLNIPGLA